jgi:hypothetical protein
LIEKEPNITSRRKPTRKKPRASQLEWFVIAQPDQREKRGISALYSFSKRKKSLNQTCLGSSLDLKRLHNILTGTTAEIIKGGMDEVSMKSRLINVPSFTSALKSMLFEL